MAPYDRLVGTASGGIGQGDSGGGRGKGRGEERSPGAVRDSYEINCRSAALKSWPRARMRMPETKREVYSPPLSAEEEKDIDEALAAGPGRVFTSSKEALKWLKSLD